MIPLIEIAGPDRAGKSSLIGKLWDRHGKDKFAYEYYEDRGVFDSIVMDEIFERTVDEVQFSRLALLSELGKTDHFAIVYLYASPDVLEQRKSEEETASDYDREYLNKVDVSSVVSVNMYDKYALGIKDIVKHFASYDTGKMSQEDIIEDLIKKEIVL
jgi:ribose 1,5-bisphosphokinase PhnN